ncbi:hypothetical protein QR680_016181 [Steinernema hermaphroditum]|uniref:Uncharacterized protein n=1 Tax=Steinernema hermaphroditum TaxID=289476 RepID=A0AA39HB99_9BILA|nr:hypothetical protein QR680_016181 [Steinernema hermaphroditum]
MLRTFLLTVLFILIIMPTCSDDWITRVKRYEYHVAMPYSSVRIQGYNPVVEWIRVFGRLSDNFKYLG